MTFSYSSRAAIVSVLVTGLLRAQRENNVHASLFLPGSVLQSPMSVTPHGKLLYILDDHTNRILAFDRDGSSVGSIGHIGSRSGEFFHPAGIGVTTDTLFVVDSENSRVQEFSFSGQPIIQYPITTNTYHFNTFALRNDGHIFINNPASGALITEYSPQGQVIRSFGNLSASPRDEYSALPSKELRLADATVRLTTDSQGNLYAAYIRFPLLRKYSRDGSLLFEKWVPPLKALVWTRDTSKGSTHGHLLLHIGRVPVYQTILDISYDPGTERLYLLGGDHNLYMLDTNGSVLTSISFDLPSLRNGSKPNIIRCKVVDGVAYLAPIYSSGLYRSGPIH